MIIPAKLKECDEVRIIAPARSLSLIKKEHKDLATKRLTDLGLKVTFGEHVEESDAFVSSSVKSRIADLHAAFADTNVKAILTVIGGYNCNQLLKYIDYDLIKRNPKILCGYSDITALQNAILAKTGLVTYSGPHYSTFSMEQKIEFTVEHFKKCLFSEEPFSLQASKEWSDDSWYLDQNKRDFIANDGYVCINEGEASGTIVGGNLCTLNLLQGTPFMPSLKGSILFLEDTGDAGVATDVEIDRNLQSLIHLPDFSEVKGLVIGRFQKVSEMTVEKLQAIVSSKEELKNLPIISGVDFGHTDPYITFPIGGQVSIRSKSDEINILIERH